MAGTTSTTIELLREDGRTYKFALEAMTSDSHQEIALDDSVGRHDY
jgi:hypothetical protein